MNTSQKKKIEKGNYWGLLSSIDLYNCDPNFIRNSDYIKEFVIKLCELIEMKRFGDTIIVNFGEDPRVSGFSMTQLIETSLISAHFANQSNNIYLDVFSCKAYDPDIVLKFAKKWFNAKKGKVNIIFRK